MNGELRKKPFVEPFCIACLESNTELFHTNEVSEDYKELIAELPQFLLGYSVQFCFACGLLMKRMKNFKRNCLQNLASIEKLVKTQQQPTAINPSSSKSAPKFYAMYERVQTRSQNRPIKDEKPIFGKRELPKERKKPHWRDNYHQIIANQPFVALEALNLNSSSPKSEYKTPTKASLKQLPTNDPESYCSVCQMHFETKHMFKHILDNHIRKKNENCWICCICEKAVRSKGAAKGHFQLHRYYEKERKCEECDLIFNRISQYKQHFVTHRSKKFICYHCDKKFLRKNDWMDHIARDHPENLQCTECGEIFDDNFEYGEHILHFHPKYPQNMNGYETNDEEVPPPTLYYVQDGDFMGTNQDYNSQLLSEDELEHFTIPLFENMAPLLQ